VSFKKGHSRTARHAHAMLASKRMKSLCKNHSMHIDTFFSEKCVLQGDVHIRAISTIFILATTNAVGIRRAHRLMSPLTTPPA
jgi:hypothetical protein